MVSLFLDQQLKWIVWEPPQASLPSHRVRVLLTPRNRKFDREILDGCHLVLYLYEILHHYRVIISIY